MSLSFLANEADRAAHRVCMALDYGLPQSDVDERMAAWREKSRVWLTAAEAPKDPA